MRLFSSALISISLATSLCAAQYNHLFDIPGDGVLSSVVEDGSGGLIAAGTVSSPSSVKKSRSYSDPFAYLSERAHESGEHLRLIHADADSQITLDTSLSLPASGRAKTIVPLGSGYAVGAEDSNGQLAVTGIDPEGKILFMRRFGSALTDRIARLIRLRDGGMLVLGTSMSTRSHNDPVYRQGMGENDLFAVRLDRHGQMIWEKKFGTKADEKAADAVECPDGSFVILGTTVSDGSTLPYLLRISENGSPVWRLDSLQNVTSAYDLLLLRDGTLMASFGTAEGLAEHPYLMQFDLQRRMLQSRRLASNNTRKLIALRERADRTLFAVGTVTDAESGGTDALALALDKQLNTLWERRFGNQGFDAFYDTTLMADGSAGIVGMSTPEGREESKMWMLKLNPDGTFAVTAAAAAELYDTLTERFSKEIAAGQMVIRRDLGIEFVDPSLYYPVGKAELSDLQKRFLRTFVPKLLATLAPYGRQIDQLRVNGHTSSKWGGLKKEEGYLNNMELSTKRAWGVLRYLYAHPQSEPHRSWLSRLLRNHGTAYADVMAQRSDDGKKARKVDLKIVLKEG